MDYIEQLREPFPANDIEWRVMNSGTKKNGDIWAKVLAYVQARAIQDRLDEVFGVFGWETEYIKTEFPEKKLYDRDGKHYKTLPIEIGFICVISIWDEDKWVKKSDGASLTDFEPFKGGISGAFKRTASAGLGIGRYLYHLEVGWADICDNGRYYGKLKDNTPFNWNPPSLPANALPSSGNNQEQKGLNPGMVKNIETLAEKFWGKDWKDQLDLRLMAKYGGEVNFDTYVNLLEDEQGLMVCAGLTDAIAKKEKVNPADVQNSLNNSQDLQKMDKEDMTKLFLLTLGTELKLDQASATIHAGKMALQIHAKEYNKLNKDEIKTLLLDAINPKEVVSSEVEDETTTDTPKNDKFDRKKAMGYIFVKLLGEIGGERFEVLKKEKFGDRQAPDWSEDEIGKFTKLLELELKE